ncbi:Aspartate/methionine/tyrosine aminotransferase (AspB) (PDB:2O0R) [Commensalibacter communis]|uniref:pyridoxal phosphate-dependent aminotransferase n=1 Tax=Commensalibacter communis TaxID=2972786 RepID=UPI0022FF8DD6|nr:pyridoxal phosphate-dependent aminotransferase [Commensalibacter communis]CAI3956259.1 Aspartate/methionine/tyrosine aminotransferase (AspB) (PDB:2O0R) [Commensalibacter communis]CAI3957872.1 Aspartate/methionine/tyrosine aminotransferase (AspB) (PDB:2O0R) [Commensalibacter communis]
MDIISDRLKQIQPSQTLVISAKAREMKAKGRDIISLSAGEPDFGTPENISQAGIRAIQTGQTKYTDVGGTLQVRQAIANRLNTDYGLDYTADEVAVSSGGKQVIFNAMMASINPEDEVIIPTPCWVSYPDIVTLAGGKPVMVVCDEKTTGFKLQPQQLREAITEKTKWLIINSPCNPTGVTYSKEELRALCDVLLEFPNVWILTDDIYAKLTYDEFVASTIVQVEPKLKERTVTMNGVSKAYSMTGWRIGYAAAPVEFIKAMMKLQGQSTTNACSISQAATIEAVSGPQDFIQDMTSTYQKRRDIVLEQLNATPGLSCIKPEGAFYLFPSIHDCIGKTSKSGVKIVDSESFVTALLEEEGVAAVHGAAFMMEGYFRISYATSTELLKEACTRIKQFCMNLQ